MKTTAKQFGDLLCGMMETPAAPGIIRGEVVVSLYFEISSSLETLEKIDDGEIFQDGESLARLSYSKGGAMVVKSRNYAEISKYAQIAEGAIKDLEFYYKINK